MEKKKETKKDKTENNLNEFKSAPPLPMVGTGATQAEADEDNRKALQAQIRDAAIDAIKAKN